MLLLSQTTRLPVAICICKQIRVLSFSSLQSAPTRYASLQWADEDVGECNYRLDSLKFEHGHMIARFRGALRMLTVSL